MFTILMISAMLLFQKVALAQSAACTEGISDCQLALSQTVSQNCYPGSTTEVSISDVYKVQECTCSWKKTLNEW